VKQQGSIDVFGAQSWYRERPEPEREIVGRLERVPPPSGPGDRPSLEFVLRAAEDSLPVYSAGVVDSLGAWVGPRVKVRGKTVDLTDEGGIREFWIAAIIVAAAD
jgi:hypothetical protein